MTTTPNSPSQRFATVLEVVFGRSQGAMAKALGCSQSIISRIVRGKQAPGAKLLMTLAEYPALNRAWVLTGVGEPLLSQLQEYNGDAALPIARTPFVGLPYDHPLCLEDVLYPVPRNLHRRSRYWIRIVGDHPFITDNNLRVADGDMVLFESDKSEWPARLINKPCLINLKRDEEDHLCFGRCRATLGESYDSRAFDLYEQIPSGTRAKSDIPNRSERRIRPILFDAEPQEKHALRFPVEIVAVAIFRCGRL